MNAIEQLRLDGSAVPYDDAHRRPDTSPAQMVVIREVLRAGTIRPVQAGTLLHALRPGGCSRRTPPTREACCRYAATDGSAMLMRMEKQGMLVRPSSDALYTLDEERMDKWLEVK